MKDSIKYISIFKFCLIFLVMLVIGTAGHTQNLTGPTLVEPNSTETYTYNRGTSVSRHIWTISGGTLVSSSNSGVAYSVIVQWGAVGNGSVAFYSGQLELETLAVTVAAPQTSGLSNQNYIHTLVPSVPTTSTTGLNVGEKIETITYFDGLGRAKQSIGIHAGGGREDIITHIGYDALGRQAKEYLPYSSSSYIASYRPNALNETNTFYDTAAYEDDFPGMTVLDINPYSETAFDNSPLNRVMKQAAPGNDWKMGGSHEIEMGYHTNTSNEVRQYEVSLSFANDTYTPTLVLNTSSGNNNGYYLEETLHKTITSDENHDGSSTKNHTTEEFKDMQGRVVLKRTYTDMDTNNDGTISGSNESQVQHDTYYVYDDYGNLTYVLPPKAEPHTAKPDLTELSELCYQYVYDDRNRLVEKKIPGKGWEYIVYNKLDQPIMTQDANLNLQNKWLVTKYDAFGRVAYTAIKNSPSTRTNFQNTFDDDPPTTPQFESRVTSGSGSYNTYYTSSARPTGINEILTINYYDDYGFDLDGGISETAYGIKPTTNPKGLATGAKVRVLDTNYWITTVTYYDEKARPIYIYSKNDYLNTTDKIKNDLSFDGLVTENTTTHSKDLSGTVTIVDKYLYDHANRLTDHRQKINNAALDEVIATNYYDNLGQLVNKGVGGKQNAPRLQFVDYDYNVRGWLKEINDVSTMGDDLFAFKINYNTKDHGGVELFNGNISETEWKTKNDNVLRWYKYEYDALNRITNGTASSSNYHLNSVSYDKNGNITNLVRRGHTNEDATDFDVMDNLAYTYESKSNLLSKVMDYGEEDFGFKDDGDQSIDYIYDDNGNMMSDTNKDITSISYNHLNLPTQINLSGGNIQYIYDATGIKQKKIVSTGTTTEYAGNFIYEDGQLKMFSHPEGYITPDFSGKVTKFEYVYQYKDHLGNVRLTYADSDKNGSIDSSTEIIEENNYYPFGMRHRGYNNVVSSNSNSVASKFKYNNTELEEALGLNLYEMPFRQYDPAIGRWTSIDPVTHHSQSTYNGYDNNPVFWADPSGADVEQIEGGVRYTGVDAQNAFRDIVNSMGGSTACDDCKEGQARTHKVSHVNALDGQETYTYVNQIYNSRAGQWQSENAYYESWRTTIRGIGQGTVDASVLDAYDLPDEIKFTLNLWAAQAYDYYGGQVPKALGNLNESNIIFDILAFRGVYTSISKALASNGTKKLPMQIHHFATNKHSVYTSQMESIASKYGLNLDGAWNKMALPHLGRHPNAYHNFVLNGMQRASLEAGGDTKTFLKLFNSYVKQPVINNPKLLRKAGWE